MFKFPKLKHTLEELEAINKPWYDYCDAHTLIKSNVHLIHKAANPVKIEKLEACIWQSCYVGSDGSYKHKDYYCIQFGTGFWEYRLTEDFIQSFLIGDKSYICVDAGGDLYIPSKDVVKMIREVLPQLKSLSII